MEAAALLLLLFTLLGAASTSSFHGDSVSFMPPQRKADGTLTLTLYHRQNGKSDCKNESLITCDSGMCTNFDKSSVVQTDGDDTGQNRWCQTEGRTTATITTNKTSVSLTDSGCCWGSNVNSQSNWRTEAELNLGTRSDLHALNSCPVTTTVASLRVPQNCFTRLSLLAHDPDGDKVTCRFTSEDKVSANFTLDETACTLLSTGQVDVGVHVFEVTLEDFPTKNITLTYVDGTSETREALDMTSPPLCKVKLQFAVEIFSSISKCEAGHVMPMFLSKTPSHGAVLYATVGQKFHLHAEAQAHHASINSFQVSGPHNMTKEFKDGKNGKAEVALIWTPQEGDLYRFVPVCFTAEANEAQSDMRCVVVMVTQASISQGKATVECSPNKMVVTLEKASMPGIDENYLKLRDGSCSLTSNSTHITGTMSFSTCGTQIEDKGDFIIFNNEINSFVLPDEVIIRRKSVQIGFSCKFPKTISISSYYTLHKSDYIFTEFSFGSFGYAFEVFTDNNFTDMVEASAYPVEVKLLQTVYMGIQAKSELANVKLFVESCKATPDDNPDNALSYDLITNGCIQDETLKIYPSNQTSFNFEVQAFKFTGNYDQVYITCSVILCEPDNPFSRCAQGCLSSPYRRRRRGLALETMRRYISQGPLLFVGNDVPVAAVDENTRNGVVKKIDTPVTEFPSDVSPMDIHWGEEIGRSRRIKEFLNTNTSTIVFASFFLVSLVSLAVVVRHFSKKRRADDYKSKLIDSALDS